MMRSVSAFCSVTVNASMGTNRRGHGDWRGRRGDEGGRLRGLARRARRARRAGCANLARILADGERHVGAIGRRLHALRDEPGRASWPPRPAAGPGPRARDGGCGPGRRSGWEACRAPAWWKVLKSPSWCRCVFAANENGLSVDESILPEIPRRFGSEKQGESRVSQAIAALRAALAGPRAAGLREGVDQRVGVAGEAEAGREASATTSPAPPVRPLPWRCVPPPWFWANCCWAACSPTLVWPSEMPACASACCNCGKAVSMAWRTEACADTKEALATPSARFRLTRSGPGPADPGAARRSAPVARCCSSRPVAGPGPRPSAWRRRAWRPAARPAADRCRRG